MDSKLLKKSILDGDITLDYKEHSIEVFEDLLIKFKNSGATHIDLYISKDYDGYIQSIEFTPIKNFYETDQEREIRIAEAKFEAEKIRIENWKKLEEKEKLELKRLKDKYENK